VKPLNLAAHAPWRERFRAPHVVWTNIAAQNGQRGIVCTNRDGSYQLYGWDIASGHLTQVTNAPAGQIQGTISADGNWIYFLHTEQGSDSGHYYRVPATGGDPHNLTPDMPPYASFYITESYSGNFLGFMTATEAGFQMFVLDTKGGATPHLRYESGDMCVGPFLSYNAEITVIATTGKSNGTDMALEAYDTVTGEKLGEVWDGAGTSIEPIGFIQRAGDLRFLATTNQGGIARPLIWQPQTGERHAIALPELEGEITPWDWSKDGAHLLLHQVHQARHQLYLYNVNTGDLHQLAHPSGTYSFGYFSPRGTLFVCLQDSISPARLVELGGLTGELKQTLLSVGNPPAGRRWQSITFPAMDGTPIQGWLVLPEGDPPYPTILHTHGGPEAVMTEQYVASAQAWVEHGLAWCSINYRGSTTFGAAFQTAIYGHPGDLESEDVAQAARWLMAQGIAQPEAILKTGGAYGGYLTLLALSKYPDLFAGGMAQSAIADWRLMYEDQPEMLRGYQRVLFGGTPDETREAHLKSSPVTYAEAVRAPLLIIQGRHDPRCPSRQMDAYEATLHKQGKEIQVEWFDAGRGSPAIDQQIDHMELMLRFAYRLLS
jgi:dienelactone hydrolase